jgi:pimeloyl-ACP methyl ester carboxylesterase
VPLLRRHAYALHYELVGAGFPLFLLPGAAADGLVWWSAGYVDELSTGFRCVLVDPPGMGGSGTPAAVESYAVDAIARDVLALADALALDRFAVWGASAGGAVGLVLAATHPQRVAALVTSGWWPEQDARATRVRLAEIAEAFRARGTRAILADLCEAEGVELPEWARAPDPNREVVARIVEGLVGYRWEEHAKAEQIPVPTLLIVGHLEDVDRKAQLAGQRMPQAEVVILPGRSHIGAWPLAPAESIAAAAPFLKRATA